MILLYILLILLFITLLYIFVLIKPNAKREFNKNLFCDYAHRGLHGNNVLENSLEAFKLACENKVGIELDVQLSKDGTAMVFHDFSLLRMTGVDKQLCELDRSELYELSLKNSEQKIPTLEEVLTLVNGQVPILVELKGELFNTSVCCKTAELLKEYKVWQDEQRLAIGDKWNDTDRLFTQWNGLPMSLSTPYKWLQDFTKKNNLPKINIHSLRHTNATLLIKRGVNVRTVAGRLGHSVTSTTLNIYTHELQSADAAAADSLSEIFKKK